MNLDRELASARNAAVWKTPVRMIVPLVMIALFDWGMFAIAQEQWLAFPQVREEAAHALTPLDSMAPPVAFSVIVFMGGGLVLSWVGGGVWVMQCGKFLHVVAGQDVLARGIEHAGTLVLTPEKRQHLSEATKNHQDSVLAREKVFLDCRDMEVKAFAVLVKDGLSQLRLVLN